MNDSKNYLLFSIGPVQEFIAAGRKTRDLFSGSLMLSYLSAKAIEAITEHSQKLGYRAETIFPSISGKINYADSSIPNRFLLSISDYSLDKINETAQAAENTVKHEFDKIIEFAKNKFTRVDKNDKIWNSYWDEQKNNFLEIYWVVLESEEEYSKIYNSLESLMGKRKALRNFNELKYGDNEKGQPGLKCSLIQNLSSVHPSKDKPTDFWRNIRVEYPQMISDLLEKEPLSAIALAKRFFVSYLIENKIITAGSDRYPSTTTIAVSSFNKELCNYFAQIGEYPEKYVNEVRDLQEIMYGRNGKTKIMNMPYLLKNFPQHHDYLAIEGDFLFEELVKHEFLSNRQEIKDKIKLVNETAKQIIKEVKRRSGKSISKYYAVIYFDGDKMGEKLGSENVNKISENLRRFSTRKESGDDKLKNIYQIIEDEHLGKVVYSGGDDVLAFISLEECMNAAFEIRNSFSRFMGNGFAGSAGIAIAHHQTDLRQVLNAARQAEEYAKETLQRDSFAFALLKRSGLSIITGTKWYSEFGEDNIKTVSEFANLISKGVISTGFVFDLITEIDGLSAFDKNAEAVLIEIKRLLLRHSNKKEERAKVEEFYKYHLEKIYQAIVKEFSKEDVRVKESPIKQLCNLLEVAQFIGQGGER